MHWQVQIIGREKAAADNIDPIVSRYCRIAYAAANIGRLQDVHCQLCLGESLQQSWQAAYVVCVPVGHCTKANLIRSVWDSSPLVKVRHHSLHVRSIGQGHV